MNGEKLSVGWSYRSATMPSCLQADLSEFSEGKGGGGFASVHRGGEKEALGLSSLRCRVLNSLFQHLPLLPCFCSALVRVTQPLTFLCLSFYLPSFKNTCLSQLCSEPKL